MEKSFSMLTFVMVTLAVLLGFLVTVAASGELPLLPPLDHLELSTSVSSHRTGMQIGRNMSRLISIHFGDQVRWRPFLQHLEQSSHHTHHRVVREYRPRPNLQSAETTSRNVVYEMGSKPEHNLAAEQFYLRGNPSASPLVSNPQTVVEVTERPVRQRIPVELTSQ